MVGSTTALDPIAIVDDDPSVRRALHRLVQSAGYAVETFASAREFLNWLPRGRAACLLLDIRMDEMNGFELQERVALPVIFMTAIDDAPTRDRIKKAGVSGHLRKPFEARAVLDAIGTAIERDRPAPGEGSPGH